MGLIAFLVAFHDWDAGKLRSALWNCGAGFTALYLANILELSGKVRWREALSNKQRWKITPIGAVCQFFAICSFVLWALAGWM
jgi:hypothetical protein